MRKIIIQKKLAENKPDGNLGTTIKKKKDFSLTVHSKSSLQKTKEKWWTIIESAMRKRKQRWKTRHHCTYWWRKITMTLFEIRWYEKLWHCDIKTCDGHRSGWMRWFVRAKLSGTQGSKNCMMPQYSKSSWFNVSHWLVAMAATHGFMWSTLKKNVNVFFKEKKVPNLTADA